MSVFSQIFGRKAGRGTVEFTDMIKREGRAERVEPPVSSPVLAASDAERALAMHRDIGFSSMTRVRELPPVTPDIAQRHATVFSCCNVIAGDLAKLPLHVYERNSKGQEVRVRDHAIGYLLNVEGAEGVPAFVTRFGLVYAYTLRGEAFCNAPRDAGGDVELIEQVTGVQVTRQGRRRFYQFEDGAGVMRTVPQRAVVHLRYMALDGWTGRSPLQVAAESVGLALAGQEAAAKAASGAQMRGVAKISAFEADEDEYRRAKRRLRQALLDGDGGIAIIGQDDSVEDFTISAADQELLSSRKFDREQIAALYRVPPSKLQMLEFGVKANGEQQAIDYKTDCLLHWGKSVEAGLAQSLLTAGERARGLFIRHHYDAMMQATTKERYDALVRAVGGPFMLWKEARKIVGLEVLAEGEAPYPPPNMTRKEDA